mmetsp:Transcript_24903/g.40355  ORF Transcript_24903/g.40355 Transcript_24903/m.40355 type:complete len:479 (+) Transcript_24903:430-1866(+)
MKILVIVLVCAWVEVVLGMYDASRSFQENHAEFLKVFSNEQRIDDHHIAIAKNLTESECETLGLQVDAIEKHAASVEAHKQHTLREALEIIQRSEKSQKKKIGKSTCMVYFGGDAKVLDKILSNVKSLPQVTYVERSENVVAASDSQFWGIRRVSAPDLPLNPTFESTHTGKGVNVYVLDSGIVIDHDEFQNSQSSRAAHLVNFVRDEPVTDLNGHGSHVAGTAAGINAGIARDANVYNIKVLNGTGHGILWHVTLGIQEAMEHANGKAGVLVMSLTGGSRSQHIEDAILEASSVGLISVVAAGNANTDACQFSPAAIGGQASGQRKMFSVASSTQQDQRSSFSNYGRCVDVFAPGSEILSASHLGRNLYATMSGTSMSAPHVAGILATLLEKHGNDASSAVNEFLDITALHRIDPSSMSRGQQRNTNNSLAQTPRVTNVYKPGPFVGQDIQEKNGNTAMKTVVALVLSVLVSLLINT